MIGNVNHNMIFCSSLQGIGRKLINFASGKSLDKTIQLPQCMFEDPNNGSLPVVWCVATMWLNFWSSYLGESNVDPYVVRADSEAK